MGRNEFGMAAAFAFLLCCALVMGLALAEGPTKEWAGWAQAVGSLLALCVAIGFPIWHGERERRSADRRKVETLTAICNNAFVLTSAAASAAACQEAAIQYINSYRPDAWKSAAAALDAVPLMELPNFELVDATIRIRSTMHEAAGQMAHAWQIALKPPGDLSAHVYWHLGLGPMVQHSKAVADALSDIASELEKLPGA